MRHALKDNERNDRKVYAVVASAKWSLCTNSKSVVEIERFITSLATLEGRDLRIRTLARELIDCDPQAPRDSIPAVMKEQKARGIWK